MRFNEIYLVEVGKIVVARTWKRRLPKGVISNASGVFTVYKSSKDYPEELRKVVCIDPEDGTKYIFLTNNLTSPAEIIP